MNEKKEGFLSIGNASKVSGLGTQTIRKLFDEKKIDGYKTPSGQRRICKSSLYKMLESSNSNEPEPGPERERKNYIYARVSTKKQMDDLSRQVKYLNRPEYDGYILIEDIGSGINFKRKGLQTILDSCLQGTIGEVVIAHRDRLCRFGYELIQTIIEKAGGTIKVLNEDGRDKTAEQELSEDLLAIIHIFSCRQMGKRKYKNTVIEDDKDKTDKTNNLSEKQT